LELAREIGAEVFLDETSGHNVHEENPEEVSRVIAEFLSR
jgi:pimeloyl-ACP methyl ester carboxylesterase